VGLPRNIFGPDHDAYRETCRTFVEKHVVPNNERWAKEGIVAVAWAFRTVAMAS
jgi:hypothetical protein